MQVQVERTDKGMLIAIPNELADSFGDTVEIFRENGRVVISSPDEQPLDIEAMIATITPENRHAEIKTGPPRGNEVW
jgi:antitoxin component of MazEF toxin-antitoxin module